MVRAKMSIGRVGVSQLVVFALGGITMACGGRTSSSERSALEGDGLLTTGEITELTGEGAASGSNGGGPSTTGTASSGPGGSTTNTGAPTTTAVATTQPDRPTRPRGDGTGSSTSTGGSTNAPTSTAIVTTTAASTGEPSTTGVPTTTSAPTTPTTTTTAPSTTSSTSSPTTGTMTDTEPTTELPPPPDMFDLPAGQAPFGLPPEYAGLDWVDDRGGACRTPSSYSSAQYCWEWFYCDDSGEGNVNCVAADGQWSCDCSNGVNLEFPGGILPGASTEEPCRAGAALCFTELPVSPTEDCDTSGQASTYDCELWRDCSSVHTADAGEIAKRNAERGTYCSSNDEGGSFCVCQDRYGYSYYSRSQFVLDRPPTDSCETALDVCVGAGEDGELGPVGCQLTFQQYTPDECSRRYSCSQVETRAETSITFFRDANANCRDIGDGNWSCYCDAGAEEHVLSSDSAKGACDAFDAICQAELMAAGIGN